MRIQKEAGILERGIAALRAGIASLLGLSSKPKPKDKARHSALYLINTCMLYIYQQIWPRLIHSNLCDTWAALKGLSPQG